MNRNKNLISVSIDKESIIKTVDKELDKIDNVLLKDALKQLVTMEDHISAKIFKACMGMSILDWENIAFEKDSFVHVNIDTGLWKFKWDINQMEKLNIIYNNNLIKAKILNYNPFNDLYLCEYHYWDKDENKLCTRIEKLSKHSIEGVADNLTEIIDETLD